MIADLLRLTLTDPRTAARRLMALQLDITTIWLGFALVLVLSLALSIASNLAFPTPAEVAERSPILVLQSRPVLATLMQAGFLILLAVGISGIGRRFGGQARFDEALTLVAWMEFTLVCLQIVQIGLLVILPPVATLVGMAGFVLFFWLLTVFTAQANGFESLPAVFMGLLVSLVLLALVTAVVFVFLGIMPMPQPGA